MKRDQLNTAIGLVDDDLISKAISAKNNKSRLIWLKVGTAAACLACIVGLGGVGAYAYYTPTSYVSLDVNPSIEYALNTFDRVLSVNGVNDDGDDILEDIGLNKLKNKSIDKAIKETVTAIAKQGYFKGDTKGGIVISVSEDKEEEAEKLSEQLEKTINKLVDEDELDVEVEAMAVGEERVQEARALGVTPGKLNLVEKLKASAENPEDIDINEWLNKSVKEIMKETKANKVLSKTDDDESDDDTRVLDSGYSKPNKSNNSANSKKSDDVSGETSSSKSNNSNNSANSKKSDDVSEETSSSKSNNSNKSDNSKKSDDVSDETNSDESDIESDETSSSKSNNSSKTTSTSKSNSSGKSNNSKK